MAEPTGGAENPVKWRLGPGAGKKVLSKGESRIPGRAISGDGKKRKTMHQLFECPRPHLFLYMISHTFLFLFTFRSTKNQTKQQEARRRLMARPRRRTGLRHLPPVVPRGSERESAFFFLLE